MPRRRTAWVQIPESKRKPYQKLAAEFCPAIRHKPFDLWQNLRIYFRAAILKRRSRGRHIARVQLALHYTWDIPSKNDLRRMKPNWAKATVNRIHKRFTDHVKGWGPGDVELVRLTLRRKPTGIDLDLMNPSEFEVAEMKYRTGAHFTAILKKLLKWEWDKLGNERVIVPVPSRGVELRGKRPVLTIDSYHHSFYKPGEAGDKVHKWRKVEVPNIRCFDHKKWEYFMIMKKNRGAEPWELTS